MNESILNTIIETNQRGKGLTNEPKALLLKLLNKLKEGEKEVLVRRFGLAGKKGETLEEVGRSRGVTRERIRQIEKNSINKLKQNDLMQEELKALDQIVLRMLAEHGGLMEEKHLLNTLLESVDNKEANKPAVLFVMDNLFEEPNLLKKHDDFYDSWYLSKTSLDDVANIITQVEDRIKEKNDLVDDEGLKALFDNIEIEQKPFDAYLTATKKIEQNNFGQWGLASWNTVTPKRVSDKVYLVLKKAGEPLHFKRITEMINEAAFADEKEANKGTVHNELILDERYILIGRGMYALNEWGYYPGTTSDVIIQFLKEKGPMDRQQIVDEVSKQRLVRPNTIKVVLMNKELFKKVDKTKYGLFND